MKQFYLLIIFFTCYCTSSGQANLSFDKNKPFKILNSKRGITNQSSATDTFACKHWMIPQKALSTIIRNCKPVDGTTWDLSFEVLPCIISGELSQHKEIYKFEINAGSWLYLRDRDTTVILGDFKKADKKYFLSQPYTN